MECCSVPGIGGISLEIAEDTAEEDIVRGCRTLATATESLWYIMSKSWTEKNNAVTPQSATKKEENYATRHANGTGPFILVSQEPGVKTVCKVNPDWWDNPNKIHNVTEVIFTQISNDATRVAALLSGQVDMAYPIPVQDTKRVDSNAATRMMVGPELGTIFLGMDQFRDELLYSNIKGKNPFKDKRVRQALYQAIDIEAIKKKVMRGLSEPSAMMVAPGVHGGGNPICKGPRSDRPRGQFRPCPKKHLGAGHHHHRSPDRIDYRLCHYHGDRFSMARHGAVVSAGNSICRYPGDVNLSYINCICLCGNQFDCRHFVSRGGSPTEI